MNKLNPNINRQSPISINFAGTFFTTIYIIKEKTAQGIR